MLGNVCQQFFCEVKMKDTKPCMLHLSHHADQIIESMRVEHPFNNTRKTPSRSDFVEQAVLHYAEHLKAEMDGQRA